MVMDLIRQYTRKDYNSSSPVMGKAERVIFAFLLPFLIINAGATAYNPVLTDETSKTVNYSKEQRVTQEYETNALASLPDKGDNLLQAMAAIADPARHGILGSISSDEVSVLCRIRNMGPVLVSKGEFLTVVSPREPLSKSFKPWDMVKIINAEVPSRTDIDLLLNREAYLALRDMVSFINSHRHSNGAHYELRVQSAYRSPGTQRGVFNRKVDGILKKNPGMSRQEAERLAARVVAPPYETEHALGFTVDFTTGKQLKHDSDPLTNRFGETPEGQMLAKEGWKYGWVNSLMPGKEKITGRETELWHWRYVGFPHSEIMKKYNWIPEEYRNYMQEKRSILFESETGRLYWVYFDQDTGRACAVELKQKTTQVAMFPGSNAFSK